MWQYNLLLISFRFTLNVKVRIKIKFNINPIERFRFIPELVSTIVMLLDFCCGDQNKGWSVGGGGVPNVQRDRHRGQAELISP